MDIFKIIATSVSDFTKKYNSTHPNPIHHSGKLFCIELPKERIKELETMVEMHCEDPGQRTPFYIYPNDSHRTLRIFGAEFKILTGDRCLIYEPSSFYSDGGIKRHIFKCQGIVIDNSVEISFS